MAPAIIQVKYMTNPGYVIDVDSFKVTFKDASSNPIASTNGGLAFRTSPGTITLGDWSASNYLITEPSDILFTF